MAQAPNPTSAKRSRHIFAGSRQFFCDLRLLFCVLRRAFCIPRAPLNRSRHTLRGSRLIELTVSHLAFFCICAAHVLVSAVPAQAATYHVSTSGNDLNPGTEGLPWATIQHAADTLAPGDTAYIHAGTYTERVSVNVSGSAAGGDVTLSAAPGETAILDGTGLDVPDTDAALLHIDGQSHVRVSHLEIRNYTTATRWFTPIGVLISGACDEVTLSDLHIHDISSTATVNASKDGRDAHGMLVRGDNATAITNLTVENCTFEDLTLGSSEALAVNGNVNGFTIRGNTIRNVDNIAIDLIGYEGTAPSGAVDRARNGTVSGNTVQGASSYGNPAYGNVYAAGGIYVDGGTAIIVEANDISGADIGMELASEHAGKTTDNIIARSNFFHANTTAGIAMGGYDSGLGSTVNCLVINNTLHKNSASGEGWGEIVFQYNIDSVTIVNNVLSGDAAAGDLLYAEYDSLTNVTLNHNLYTASGGPTFFWRGVAYEGLSAFSAATGQDTASLSADPLFTNGAADDCRPLPSSPVRDAGEANANIGSTDFDGDPRVQGSAPDIGAWELPPVIVVPVLLLLS